MIRAIDAVFLGRHQYFRAVHAGLVSQPLEFEGLIRMVVVEEPAKHDIEPERFESAPKILGIAQAAKSGYPLAGQTFDAGAGLVIAPAAGEQAGAEGGRGGIESAQTRADGLEAQVVFGSCDDER